MAIACSTTIGCSSSLEETLATIKSLGFSCVDVLLIENWVHLNPSRLAAEFETSQAWLSGLLARFALMPVAINTGVSAPLYLRSVEVNEKRLREIEALARLAQRLGVSVAAYQGHLAIEYLENEVFDAVDSTRRLLEKTAHLWL